MSDAPAPFGVESTIQATTGGSHGDSTTGGRERYDYKGSLGQGGMGTVEWVWDRDLVRDLAIKRIRHDADKRGMLPRFLWEARVTAALNHPNIVPVYDIGTTPSGDIFYSMKRIDGRTLEDIIEGTAQPDGSQLPVARRLRLFVQIANAVAYAHDRGVVHRDLKPANIMVGDHGEVVVMDWGLAESFDDSSELGSLAPPRGTGISGTPLYMSPEQACGEPTDARSDVYSLGVILYELVSTQRPYSATTASELLDQVKRGQLAPLSEREHDGPSTIDAVVTRALATAPTDRYSNAAELREDVERVVDGLTPKAESASIAKRLARFYKHKDPRFARMRVLDVDMMAFGMSLLGGGIGVLIAGHVPWPVAIIVSALGAALATPFHVKWLRPGDR